MAEQQPSTQIPEQIPEQKLAIVSSSPHVRSKHTTRVVMLDVCIALMPALAAAVWHFGTRSLVITAISVASCIAFEALCNLLMKRPLSIKDCSAVVTGLLLALGLPPTLPLWMIPIGAFVAIAVVKQLFGGLGQNFANPAATARIVLVLSFALPMTTWTAANGHSWGADAIATATPMNILAAGEGALPGLLQMLLGQHGGSIGETCALALLLGGIYLCLRRVISPLIPLCYIGTVALLSLFKGGFDLAFVAYQLLGGSMLLGAIFMATDYATTPISARGKIVFAVGCGLFTCLIRFYSNMPEGVSFAILIMNLLSPHIERLTIPRAFGARKEKRNA